MTSFSFGAVSTFKHWSLMRCFTRDVKRWCGSIVETSASRMMRKNVLRPKWNELKKQRLLRFFLFLRLINIKWEWQRPQNSFYRTCCFSREIVKIKRQWIKILMLPRLCVQLLTSILMLVLQGVCFVVLWCDEDKRCFEFNSSAETKFISRWFFNAAIKLVVKTIRLRSKFAK